MYHCILVVEYLTFDVDSESDEKMDEDQLDDDEVGFERIPKPMLPFSSLFIFGPTNP